MFFDGAQKCKEEPNEARSHWLFKHEDFVGIAAPEEKDVLEGDSEAKEGKGDGKTGRAGRLVTAVSYLLRRLQDLLLDATVLLARTRTRAHDLGHDSLSHSLSLYRLP